MGNITYEAMQNKRIRRGCRKLENRVGAIKIFKKMRKLIYLIGIMLFLQQGYGQQNPPWWIEDFEGGMPPLFQASVTPSGAWMPNTTYHLPGSSTSYWGTVPNRVGDSTILLTEYYDCTLYPYVSLRFTHICKISPNDRVRIEYRENMMAWKPIPPSA